MLENKKDVQVNGFIYYDFKYLETYLKQKRILEAKKAFAEIVNKLYDKQHQVTERNIFI